MEILVAVSEVPSQHESDAIRAKDPIIYKPDGWGWSIQEKKKHIVVRLPDDAFTEEGWKNLTLPQVVEREVDGVRKDVQIRMRRYGLDYDKLPADELAVLHDHTIVHPVMDGVFRTRDFTDKEQASPRFQKGDKIKHGRI